MAKVKTAVIGCGLWGEIHGKAYWEYEAADLVVLCDINEARAKELASRFRCAYTTKSEDVANNEEIQAVSIATPDFAHHEVALEMIAAGKHLLVEKPLATTIKEAQQIVRAAKKKGVKLMVDFHNRWNPAFVKAKEIIESGRFGKAVMAYLRLSNPLRVPVKMLSWSRKSGPEWFLFPHIVDLARWLFEQEAEEVYASGRKELLRAKGIDAYDAIQAHIKLTDSFVTVETCWILPNSWPSVIDFKATLFGSEGRIALNLDDQGMDITIDTFERPFLTIQQNIHGQTTGFAHLPIRHFVDCVAQNKRPLATGEDGLTTTAIIECILNSIQSGKPVKVPKFKEAESWA